MGQVPKQQEEYVQVIFKKSSRNDFFCKPLILELFKPWKMCHHSREWDFDSDNAA